MPSTFPLQAEPPVSGGFSRRWFVLVGAVLAVVVGVSLFLRVNLTPSVATGLYLQVPEWLAEGSPEVGDLVTACAPVGDAARVALDREYLRRTRTACASGIVPVLKRVVAVGGQTVEVGPDGVLVDGRRIAPAPQTVDSEGRPLEPQVGTWPLGPGDLWLGSDIPNGFDSRYFGVFPPDLLRGRAWLLASFD